VAAAVEAAARCVTAMAQGPVARAAVKALELAAGILRVAMLEVVVKLQAERYRAPRKPSARTTRNKPDGCTGK